MSAERSSLLILLLIATTAAGQNFPVNTTVLATISAEITNFSVVTNGIVDFLFTVLNTGNTNISAFPEITINDSNNNIVVILYGDSVNIPAGETRNLTLSWIANRTGTFTAKLTVYFDNNTRWVNASRAFTLKAHNGTLRGAYIKSGTIIGVSGATVNITNSTLGSIIRTTDTQGNYIVSLSPAIYTINVTAIGYQSNSTTATVASNITTTVPVISLSPNTVTVVANRTTGTAEQGQNVSFNLTVTNTGDNATFAVITSVTNLTTIVTNTTTPSPLLLNTTTSTGYVVVVVNNSNFGGWPVTITVRNTSQSKSASVTLNAIMRNATANFTNISSIVINATVTGATLVNTTVQSGAIVSGNSTLIMNATVTGSGSIITDGAIIRGDYGDSSLSNSSVGNATVVSSNLTSSTISSNASVTNSTLIGATVSNSTLTNVTVRVTSTITNVANLNNITLAGVTVTGDPNYAFEGAISGGTGWATYQTINFTRVYTDVRISQLVIEQSSNQPVASNTPVTINDTTLGTSMNFSMTVNLSNPALINISETGISPDGSGTSSTGTMIGNFLYVRSNDTANVTSHTLRLYFDTDPSTYTGGVAIYFYNTSTSAWEAVRTTASGTEGGRFFREAAPNHFSTFALLGTTTAGGEGGVGGVGGVGGGGVVTTEPLANIADAESYKRDLIANLPIIYKFTESWNIIYEIVAVNAENESDVAIRVERLKSTSKRVASPAPGIVYTNLNIWAGTNKIKEALIRFKVENSWISSNNLATGEVKMLKWDGSKWVQLDTTEILRDTTYTYYEAKTQTISHFAVSGVKGIVVPTETRLTPTSTIIPAAAVPTLKLPAIPVWVYAVIALILIVIILYALKIFKRNNRNQSYLKFLFIKQRP